MTDDPPRTIRSVLCDWLARAHDAIINRSTIGDSLLRARDRDVEEEQDRYFPEADFVRKEGQADE